MDRVHDSRWTRIGDPAYDTYLMGELDQAVRVLSAKGALVAQSLAKRAVDDGLDGSLSDGISLEQELFAEVFATDDAAIGVKSFLEKGPGKAEFTGR